MPEMIPISSPVTSEDCRRRQLWRTPQTTDELFTTKSMNCRILLAPTDPSHRPRPLVPSGETLAVQSNDAALMTTTATIKTTEPGLRYSMVPILSTPSCSTTPSNPLGSPLHSLPRHRRPALVIHHPPFIPRPCASPRIRYPTLLGFPGYPLQMVCHRDRTVLPWLFPYRQTPVPILNTPLTSLLPQLRPTRSIQSSHRTLHNRRMKYASSAQ